MKTVWIAAGGPNADERVLGSMPADAHVIAADSGADLIVHSGRVPDLVVGDMDSIASAVREQLEAADVRFELHRTDKDASDLELALDAALASWPGAAVTVVAGDGGRLDHQLANLAVLASARYDSLWITAHIGPATVVPVHTQRVLTGRAGDVVSLFAVAGPVRGVTTTGLAFALDNAELVPGTSLGLSNRFVAESALVRVDDGALLAIQP